MLLVNIFPLISNEILISLHRYLDSTHTNYATTMCGVLNYIYYMAILLYYML
jgi:mRNA deadenylase 3'-5' endonuclease subunit Ccr4